MAFSVALRLLVIFLAFRALNADPDLNVGDPSKEALPIPFPTGPPSLTGPSVAAAAGANDGNPDGAVPVGPRAKANIDDILPLLEQFNRQVFAVIEMQKRALRREIVNRSILNTKKNKLMGKIKKPKFERYNFGLGR